MVVYVKKFMKFSVLVIIIPTLLSSCSEVLERSAKLAARQAALAAARKANENFPTTTSTISEPERKMKAAVRVAKVKTGSLPTCIRRRANSSDCSFLKLMDSNFNKTDLSKYLFNGADLNGSTFIGANLQNADLSNANLENCDFSYADLSGASLVGAKLRGATMPDGTVHD
jgi:uncharacterized protein YjbI with pentapeptide repeats